jgi:hypothetical protein
VNTCTPDWSTDYTEVSLHLHAGLNNPILNIWFHPCQGNPPDHRLGKYMKVASQIFVRMAATLMPLALCQKWVSPLRRVVLGFRSHGAKE